MGRSDSAAIILMWRALVPLACCTVRFALNSASAPEPVLALFGVNRHAGTVSKTTSPTFAFFGSAFFTFRIFGSASP
jgi:hypothetical protein